MCVEKRPDARSLAGFVVTALLLAAIGCGDSADDGAGSGEGDETSPPSFSQEVQAVLQKKTELIEELATAGGGYGLFTGCAAGDTALAVIVRVD